MRTPPNTFLSPDPYNVSMGKLHNRQNNSRNSELAGSRRITMPKQLVTATTANHRSKHKSVSIKKRHTSQVKLELKVAQKMFKEQSEMIKHLKKKIMMLERKFYTQGYPQEKNKTQQTPFIAASKNKKIVPQAHSTEKKETGATHNSSTKKTFFYKFYKLYKLSLQALSIIIPAIVTIVATICK